MKSGKIKKELTCSEENLKEEDCSTSQQSAIETQLLLTHIDNTIDDNINYLQEQLNLINKSYLDIYATMLKSNENYKNLLEKISKMSGCFNRPPHLICSHKPTVCGKNKIMYSDPNKEFIHQITSDINFIYITMVAGGGAGGIGYVDGMYYYAGGGGGAGSCVIQKPIDVKKGYYLKIKVGKGGNILEEGGTPSTVEVYESATHFYEIKTYGGLNGFPCIINNNPLNKIVEGGKGGVSKLICVLNGCDGEPGSISIPSCTCAKTGNGAPSLIHCGGKGGGNYFSEGGIGGIISDDFNTIINLVGSDGRYGSGGGGSAPKSKIDFSDKLSGNGGDGLIIVEW